MSRVYAPNETVTISLNTYHDLLNQAEYKGTESHSQLLGALVGQLSEFLTNQTNGDETSRLMLHQIFTNKNVSFKIASKLVPGSHIIIGAGAEHFEIDEHGLVFKRQH